MWKMTNGVMRFPTPPPSLVKQVSEKSNTLARSLEAHFLPVTDHSVPAVTEKVDEADCFTPAGEYKKTKPDEVEDVFGDIKV